MNFEHQKNLGPQHHCRVGPSDSQVWKILVSDVRLFRETIGVMTSGVIAALLKGSGWSSDILCALWISVTSNSV